MAKRTLNASNYVPAEITPTEIVRLRGESKKDAALALTDRFIYLENLSKRSFVEKGLIMVEVDERELFWYVNDPETGRPYEKFTRWVEGSAPYSRSECFAAKAAILKLKDVPTQDLLEMSRCNVEVLTELSTNVRQDPEIIQAAKTSTENEFEEKIQAKYPTQHREPKRAIFVKPTQSGKQVMEHGLKVAGWAYEATSREQIIEQLFRDFMDSDCEVEGYTHDPETGEVWTNEQAYEVAKSRGQAA